MADVPFGQMSDDQVDELARRMGIAMPPRNAIPGGNYFAPNAGTAQQLAPLGGGVLGPANRPDPNAPPLPAAAAPFAQAGIPNLGSQAGFDTFPAGLPPAADRTAATGGGEAKSLAGPDPSQLTPRGGSPFAAPENPFAPHFVETGMPGMGQGVFANNRDQEIAALAQQTATRTAGHLIGTGFGADGDYYTPNGAAYNLHAAQLGQAAGSDVMRMLQGTDATQEQARQAEANRQAEVEKANIAGRAHVAGAAAAHSPQALRGAAMGDLFKRMITGGMTPQQTQSAFQAINAMGGSTPAEQAAFGDAANRFSSGRSGTATVSGALGTETPQGFQPLKDYTPKEMADLAARLAALERDPAGREAAFSQINSGNLGDPQKIRQAAAAFAAANAFKANPPTGPDGKPIDFYGVGRSRIPGSYIIPGSNGQPLITLGVRPSNPLVPNLSNFIYGGVPYDQISVAGGPAQPFATGQIGSTFDRVIGRTHDTETMRRQAAAMLQLVERMGDGGQAFQQKGR